MTSHVREKDRIWVSKSNPLLQWMLMLFLLGLGVLFITTLWDAPKEVGSIESTCFIVGWLLCALSMLAMSSIERCILTVDLEAGSILVSRQSLSKHTAFQVRFVDIEHMRLVSNESTMLIRYFIEISTRDGRHYHLFDDAFDDVVDLKKMTSTFDRLQRIVKSYNHEA